MQEQIIFSLIKSIVPNVIEDAVSKASCFRTFVIKLPETTNKEELISAIKEVSNENKLWKTVEKTQAESVSFEQMIKKVKGPTDLMNKVESTDPYIIFENLKKSVWSPNWPQLTFVILKEIDPTQKFLIISSFFAKTQIVERGVLTRNCVTIIDKVREFYLKKNIDISPNISQAKLYADSTTKHDKPLSTTTVILGIIISILVIIGAFFVYIKIFGQI